MLPAEEARESAQYNVHREGKVDCYYPWVLQYKMPSVSEMPFAFKDT